jgi:hypothetical protein
MNLRRLAGFFCSVTGVSFLGWVGRLVACAAHQAVAEHGFGNVGHAMQGFN